MNAEIIQNADSKFDLIVDGQIIKSYTRKSDAKRGLERYLSRQENQEQSCAVESDGATTAESTAQLPPASNTGGQQKADVAQLETKPAQPFTFRQPEKFNSAQASKSAPISAISPHYIMVDGKVKEIPLRIGKGTAAHIDTLTLTFSKGSLFTKLPEQYQQLATEEEEDEFMLIHAEEAVKEIFGFGFSKRGNGRNGYAKTVNMGMKSDETIMYGFFGWGNGDKQGNTVCLHLSGVGLTAALDGWETRLYAWIKTNAPFAKITRIDLAHDFLNGEYTPLQAYIDWQNGLYKSASTNPSAEMAGKGWLNDPESGRTLYIGSKKNGSRLVRVYEKGIEQGDKTSPWVRFELQLRNRDIVIDHEILLAPGEYLTGAYPITQQLFSHYDENLKKPDRIQKLKEISVEHCVYHLSIQAGPTIKALRYMGFESAEITEIIENPGAKMSKRLHPAAFDANSAPYIDFIKNNQRKPTNDFELYQFVANKYLTEQQEQSKESNLTPEQVQTLQKQLKEEIYLRVVFSKNGYKTARAAGYEYQDYVQARHGTYQNSTQTHKETQT